MKVIFSIELIGVLGLLLFMIGRSINTQEDKIPQEHQKVQELQTVMDVQEHQKVQELQAVIGVQEPQGAQELQKMQEVMEVKEQSQKQEITEEGITISGNDIALEEQPKVEDILLVNKDNKLPDNYQVELKTLPDGVNRAAKEAYEPLCDMLQAGRKEGLYFEICSSYRDVKRQEELFEEDMAILMRSGYSYEEAYAEVAKETMPPGYSEHSTGLAFDIVALGYQMLDAGQERTAENKWLQAHCAEYGFILRYPKGKEDITAISYESWHFRYVGKEVAEYIMENGITLEEYLEN